MKLDAATDPSGRDHSLGTQGRHWDYCSSLRVEPGGMALAQARVINSTGGFPVEDPVGFSDDCLVFSHVIIGGKRTSEPQVVVPASRRVKIMREIWSPRSTPGSCWIDRNSMELPPKLTLEALKNRGLEDVLVNFQAIFHQSMRGNSFILGGLLIEQRQNCCCVIIPIGTEGPGACMIFEQTFIYNQAPR